MFLSVDPGRLSNNPLKITKPRDTVMQQYTDSIAGQHSTSLQGDDAIKPGPSGAGKVTCQISDHVEPDLADSKI